MENDLLGPGRFSVTYVSRGGWDEGWHTRRIVLDEGQGWEAAKERLWKKYHFDPLTPHRPTFELHCWTGTAK